MHQSASSCPCRSSLPALGWMGDQAGEDRGGLGLHPGDDMLVDGHREGRVRVPKTLADDLHRDTCLEQQRRMGVSEIVKRDLG